MSYQAAVTSPHHLATLAGEKILAKGGNAVEACIAVASALTVVYPHMTSLGGDGFWLIHRPGELPVALNAAGFSAKELSHAEFGQHMRGPKTALTTAGAVAGWHAASERYPGHLTLSDLFESAINYAEQGFMVSESLHNAMVKLAAEYPHKDLLEVFYNQGKPYNSGDLITLPALAETYRRLAKNGLQDWYSGELAKENAKYLSERGSPITFDDIESTQAGWFAPLVLDTAWGEFYNFGAPTQGGASLNILGLLNKMITTENKSDSFWQSLEGEEYALHHLIESVKIAFEWRNLYLNDSLAATTEMQQRLSETEINQQYHQLASTAAPWPSPGPIGDTVWMGVVDSNGLAVSYIQSIYWEFGSGVVNPTTGVVWNNRSLGFSTDPEHPNAIGPQRQPMHTLNPPMALLNDGTRLVYGTMGGEGQPQTQAAIIWRYLVQKTSLEQAIAAPRWLLGKTWGKAEDNLKLGESLFKRVGEKLRARGHDLVNAPDMAEFFGHAGAIHIKSEQSLAASDPRSDGKAIVVSNNNQPNNIHIKELY